MKRKKQSDTEKGAMLTRARQVSRCLQAVAHEIRLGVLAALQNGEQNVGQLVETIGCAQPTLSQHLRTMLDRGLLLSRRDGNQVFYRVRDKRIFRFLSLVREVFCEQ